MKIEKIEKLVANLHDTTEYVIHITNLKQALNNGLVLKNVWLRKNIDLNTDLGKEAKTDFEKDFFNLESNAVFGKTMENVRKHRDIRLVTTERRRNYLI